MNHYKIKAWTILATLILSATSAPALARNTSAMDDFASAKPVTRKEMDHMRGGYIDANGVLFSVGYNASINGVPQSSFTISTLAQAASAIKNLQTIITVPTSNTVNNFNQTLTINAINPNLNPFLSVATAFAGSRSHF